MFTKIDDTHFKLIGEKSSNIFPTLESKVYNMDIQEHMFGVDYVFSPLERYENSTVAQVGIFKEVYEYTKGFFSDVRINLRKEMGFINKMNLILKGNPGTGKTHLACTVASELVKEHNGIGIVVDTISSIKFDKLIDRIRINEPDRLIIFVLDELEKNNHNRLINPDFLSFLDGAKSRENVIIIATVNSVANFPNFLINRPGRFEKIFDFVFNTEEVLSDLTKILIPERYAKNTEVIEDLVATALLSNVKTIDELRFLILDYLVAFEKGVDFPKEVARIDITPEVPNKEPDRAIKQSDIIDQMIETMSAN